MSLAFLEGHSLLLDHAGAVGQGYPLGLLRYSHRDSLSIRLYTTVPDMAGCHELKRPALGSCFWYMLVDTCSPHLSGSDLVHGAAASCLIYPRSTGSCTVISNNSGSHLRSWFGGDARHTQTHHDSQSNHHSSVGQVPTTSSSILQKSMLLVLPSSS